jgi:hypothetical protein
MHVLAATPNGLPSSKLLLTALQRNSFSVHTVVIDNASSDGMPDWIAGLRRYNGRPAVASGLTLVPQDRNTGVGTAWNIGLWIAPQNLADRILVCGNDTLPMPGAIERPAAVVDEGVPFVTGTTVPHDKAETAIALARPDEPLPVAPEFSLFMFRPAAIEVVVCCDCAFELELAAKANGDRPAALPNPRNWGVFNVTRSHNCTDEQWKQFRGGYPLSELSREQAIAAGRSPAGRP